MAACEASSWSSSITSSLASFIPASATDAASATLAWVTGNPPPPPPPPPIDTGAGVAQVMCLILLGQLALLFVIFQFLTPVKEGVGRWLPPPKTDKGTCVCLLYVRSRKLR